MQNRICQTEFISLLHVSLVDEGSYGGIRFFVMILILYHYLSDKGIRAIQHSKRVGTKNQLAATSSV